MIQPLLLRQTYLICWLAGIMSWSWPLPSLLVFLATIVADSRLRGAARMLCAAAIFGLGWLYFTLTLPAVPKDPPPWLAQYSEHKNKKHAPRLTGTVEDVQGLPGERLRIFLSSVRSEGEAQAMPGLVMWIWEKPDFTPGRKQNISITMRPREISGLINPGVFNPAEWWRMRGVFWRIWSRGQQGDPKLDSPPSSFWSIRDNLRDSVNRILLEGGAISQAKAIIPAILFGDRRFMEKTTLDLFADATLIHSLALSGQHLTLAGMAAAMLIFVAGRIAPGIFQFLPRNKMIIVSALPFAAVYIWLGDAPPSLLRSGWMMLLLAIWIWKERPHTLMDGLCGALLCMSVADPLVCHDLGFQLSVLCIAAMALSMPLIHYLPNKKSLALYMPAPAAAALYTAISTAFVSFAISIVLQPLITLVFGTGSPWFFLNVFWLPFVGLWVMPVAAMGLVCAGMQLDGAAGFMFSLASLPGEALINMLAYMRECGLLTLPALLRPHYSALLGFGAALLAVSLLPGRKDTPAAAKRLFAIAVPLLLVGPLLRYVDYLDPNIRMRLIDVGQGQAVLLELPQSRRVLIDGGGVNSNNFDPGQAIVAPLLTANKPPKIDLVINSHPDNDHVRGLIYILQHFSVGEYLHNGEAPAPAIAEQMENALKNVKSRVLTATPEGDDIQLGENIRLEALSHAPWHGFKGNNASIVLRLTYFDKGLAIISGDVERQGIERILASGRSLSAETLVLPHHGSARSLSKAFYDATAPRLALISSGKNNSYGLPSKEVLAEMRRRHIETLNTADVGHIMLEWSGKDGQMLDYQRKR